MIAHSIRQLIAIAAFLAVMVALALGADRPPAGSVVQRCAASPGGPTTCEKSRDQRRYERYHWYELSDEQDARLRAALRGWRGTRSVLILSATADSLSLAEDIDSALHDTGRASRIDRPQDVVDGAHCTDAGLAGIIKSATGISCEVDADETGGVGDIVVNFGRKR